jgi:archaellum component FlaC
MDYGLNDKTERKILRLLDVLAVDVSAVRNDTRGLDAKIDGLDRRLGRVETRVEGVETEMRAFRHEVETRFEGVETELRSVRHEYARRIAPLER